MSATVVRKREPQAEPARAPVTIGSDLLSLISMAMYVEPLTIYREYVQNAADSIDEARRLGLLGAQEPGTIEAVVNTTSRTIHIRDNGIGIPGYEFGSRMRALGASGKRGTSARGFRGVGRLGGLAYAQRVVFRSRSSANEPVLEFAWDCRRLRTGLKQRSETGLAAFVESVTTLSELDGDWPTRFFEVELEGVVRQGDDRLLRPESVADYLSQVAPVPFNPDFSLASELNALLEPHLGKPLILITVNGGEPLTRPHRDNTAAGSKEPIGLHELTSFEVPGLDGGVAAIGWVAHHDYDGAIPQAAMIKGLRARVGNIQVGGSSLLQDVFPEARFCAWTVGEVHVLDSRIVPNGRRDNFEQNGHHANLINHLGPIGRDIARRCRTSSAERQRRRTFEAQVVAVEQQLDILEQGATGSSASADLARLVQAGIARLEKAVGSKDVADQERRAMRDRVERLKLRFSAAGGGKSVQSPLQRLPAAKRRAYQEVIDLIYECSANRVAAKALVDRLMQKIGERQTEA